MQDNVKAKNKAPFTLKIILHTTGKKSEWFSTQHVKIATLAMARMKLCHQI